MKSSEEFRIRILDRQDVRYLDVFRLVLFHCAKDTLLPELYEIFGSDKLIKFLDLFGGCVVKVPSRDLLEGAVRDVSIYVRLSKCSNPEEKSAKINDLAFEYDLSRDMVVNKFVAVSKLVKSSELKL